MAEFEWWHTEWRHFGMRKEDNQTDQEKLDISAAGVEFSSREKNNGKISYRSETIFASCGSKTE